MRQVVSPKNPCPAIKVCRQQAFSSEHYSHDTKQTRFLSCVPVQMQGVVQQQFVVRAVQLECKCMQHECSRQASAIQLLESAADQRRMEERRLQHDFWDVAREALGMIVCPLL